MKKILIMSLFGLLPAMAIQASERTAAIKASRKKAATKANERTMATKASGISKKAKTPRVPSDIAGQNRYLSGLYRESDDFQLSNLVGLTGGEFLALKYNFFQQKLKTLPCNTNAHWAVLQQIERLKIKQQRLALKRKLREAPVEAPQPNQAATRALALNREKPEAPVEAPQQKSNKKSSDDMKWREMIPSWKEVLAQSLKKPKPAIVKNKHKDNLANILAWQKESEYHNQQVALHLAKPGDYID